MEDLHEIIRDLSIGGKYTQFYEQLMQELDKISEERIDEMKETLVFVHPHKKAKIEKYDKMRVLYEYSLLV